MHDPIKYLVNQGFETVYISYAIDLLKDRTKGWRTPDAFIEEIARVLDDNDVLGDVTLTFFEARYTYFYVVQNLLLTNKRCQVVEQCDLIAKSLEQSRAFCVQHKLVLEEEARELGIVTETNTKGTRSGTKTERALQIFAEEVDGKDVNDPDARATIMQRFQDELQMEKSGALTYYHATKKRFLAATRVD